MSHFIAKIFPAFIGVKDALHSVDASIISDQGRKVMTTQKYLDKVNQAVEKRNKNQSSGSKLQYGTIEVDLGK